MRYIAVRQTDPKDKSTATIYLIGKDDICYAVKRLEMRVTKRLQQKYGKGPEYTRQLSIIRILTLHETLKYYPTLRDSLRKYDEAYAAKRDQVERNQRVAAARVKVGVRFGPG